MIDHSSASTDSIATVAFGLWEGKFAWLTYPYVSFVHLIVAGYLIDTPPVFGHRIQTGFRIFRSRSLIIIGGGVSNLQGVGANHQFVGDNIRATRPREVYRTIIGAGVEVVILRNGIGSNNLCHIKFQAIQHHSGVGIGLSSF